MAESEQEQLSSEKPDKPLQETDEMHTEHLLPTKHDRPEYHISPKLGRLILLAFILSVPGWFLSDLFKVNGLITFFTIFFTVLSTATGFFQIVSMRHHEPISLAFPWWLSRLLSRISQTIHVSVKRLIAYGKWGIFALALAAILVLGIWNVGIDLTYQLDSGILFLSGLLLLLGMVSTLYFLPALQKRLQTALERRLPTTLALGRWPIVLLMLMLALSGFWNIGQYRIADVCDGAQAPSSLNGMGAIVRGRECIGLSDGATIFDAGRPNGAQKRDAANQLRHGASRARVLSLFDEAIAADPTDAEALIYREDLWIGSSPHITIVVAATLSGLYSSDGRDTLQGVYVAQKEYNDTCQQQGSACPLLNVLIANTGSGVTDEAQYTHDVTVQIMQAAKKDPTIVAIMDGLASQSTFDINDEVMAHPDHILPMVAAKATSDFLTRMPHFLRIAPTNSLQAQMGARYAKSQLNSSRVAIFYRQENTYSGNLKDDFINEYQDANHQVVAVAAYPGRDPGVLQEKLSAVLALKPDLIYCACYSNEVSVILEHLPTTGPFAHLLVLGGDAFFETGDFTPGALTHLSRLRFTALAYPAIWHDLPTTSMPFFADYGKLFEPANPYAAQAFSFTHLTPGIMVAYDAMLTLTTAAMRTFVIDGQAQTPQNLEHALFQMQGKQAIQGITGQISVGGNGDPINKAIVVLAIDNSNSFHCIWLYGQFLVGKPAPPDQLNNGQTCTTAAG